jgi:hypothetical protein
MNGQRSTQVYYRLVALWILCEAMLGGIIHAMRIPISGLIVGSAAVICICLIAHHTRTSGSIIKATIIVCIFKMMLSPQAPGLAYVAVLFQGVMGELLFLNRRIYKLSCLLLGLIALLESGLQRIIVLTIVYGNNLWHAINDFLNGLTRQKSFTNYSLAIGIAYLSLHIIAGLVAGRWAAVIPQKIAKWRSENIVLGSTPPEEKDIKNPALATKGKFKMGLFLVWLVLLLIYLQSYLAIGKPLLPPRLPLQIMLRSLLIILAWWVIVGPLLGYAIRHWLNKEKAKSRSEIDTVARLLPGMKLAVKECWEYSRLKTGINRMILFAKLILVRTVYMENG